MKFTGESYGLELCHRGSARTGSAAAQIFAGQKKCGGHLYRRHKRKLRAIQTGATLGVVGKERTRDWVNRSLSS